jgi:hypothetical protein
MEQPDTNDTLVLVRPGVAETGAAVTGVADRHDTISLPASESPELLGFPTLPASALAGYPYQQVQPPTGNWYPRPVAPPAKFVVRHNNFAVVGATLGSISLFLALIPVFGMVAWLLAPVGLMVSGIGLLVGLWRHSGRLGASYGLVTSGLALAVCFCWLLLVLG